MNRDTVCTPEQARQALGISERQWAKRRHLFPWSYKLGPRCPRIVWGRVLEIMESSESTVFPKLKASA